MSERFSATLIGAFVMGAVALALVALMVFGSASLFQERRKNVLYFSGSVKGLNVGSPVMFRGVPIGQVEDIRVIFDSQTLNVRIPVVIATDPTLIQPAGGAESLRAAMERHGAADLMGLMVERGLRAQLQMQSLVTGQLFVQLDFFPQNEPRYLGQDEEYKEIPTVLSNFAEVSKTLEQIPLDQLVRKVMATLDGIEKLVNDPKLAASIDSLDQALRAISDLAGNVDARMSELSTSVGATMKDVRVLATHVDAEVGPVGQDLRKAAKAASRAFDRTEKALSGLEGTVGAGSAERRDLRRALQEIAAAARAVRVLAETLEMQPDLLLRGRQGSEP
jgi:paraquat-inducible protein B